MLATAVAGAALIGAGTVAALTAFVSEPSTVIRQVTVGGDTEAVAESTSSIAAIYESTHKAVVEITVTGASWASRFGGGRPRRHRAPASSTTSRAT